MGRVSSSLSGARVRTVAFTDDLANPRRSWLAAVVYWRISAAAAEAESRMPPELVPLVREFETASPERQEEIAAAFAAQARKAMGAPRPGGFLGFHLKGSEPGDWAASGEGRGRVEYFSGQFVRVLGRKYPMPPDNQTLVLLVDDENEGASPRIAAHTIKLPVAAQPERAESPDEATFLARINEFHSGRNEPWTTELNNDPTIRDFLRDH